MTSREYWQSLEFDYAETFSLLRGDAEKSFFDLTQKQIRDAVDKHQQKLLHDLCIRGSINLLEQTGVYHPTAIKTNVLDKNSAEIKQLADILNIAYDEQAMWMCGYTFRDSIVFYKDQKIVSYLNICLSCDWVETTNELWVQTDNEAFSKLRALFLAIGHKVEEK